MHTCDNSFLHFFSCPIATKNICPFCCTSSETNHYSNLIDGESNGVESSLIARGPLRLLHQRKQHVLVSLLPRIRFRHLDAILRILLKGVCSGSETVTEQSFRGCSRTTKRTNQTQLRVGTIKDSAHTRSRCRLQMSRQPSCPHKSGTSTGSWDLHQWSWDSHSIWTSRRNSSRSPPTQSWQTEACTMRDEKVLSIKSASQENSN